MEKKAGKILNLFQNSSFFTKTLGLIEAVRRRLAAKPDLRLRKNDKALAKTCSDSLFLVDSDRNYMQIIFRSIITFFLLFSQAVVGADGSIIFRMHDMNHKPIDQAMCQAPFVLQVELKNLDDYTDTVLMRYIPGIENFKSSRSISSRDISIDNGKKTTKNVFDFILRSDKKGNFTVGPLILNDKNGKPVKSNRLIIAVGDEVVSSTTYQKEKYFLKAYLDKKQAYVGEKIKLHIQFYDRLFVEDLHLKFPDFPNLYLVKNQKNAKKSLVEIEEQEYSLTEWIFDLYAMQAGQFIMQDITAAFFAPELANKFMFGGAFDFFRSLHKTEQYLVANPLKMDIIPLPDDKKYPDVHAVGQFSQFQISINQDTAQVAQGVTLTTDLFGDGNFEIMGNIPLILPENFNYYDSNMVKINDQRNHKHSEFIVQASQDGQYQIPSQKLIYFDPTDGSYKTLLSNALSLNITPATQQFAASYVADDQIDIQGDQGEKRLEDFKIITTNSIVVSTDSMISLNLFFMVLVFLFLLWFILFLHRYDYHNYILRHKKIVKLRVFFRAYQQCKQARATKDFKLLHDLFSNLFSQLLDRKVGHLQDVDMINYLIEKNFSLDQIQSWKIFYHKILQLSFSAYQDDQQSKLFDQAFMWIKLLKGKA